MPLRAPLWPTPMAYYSKAAVDGCCTGTFRMPGARRQQRQAPQPAALHRGPAVGRRNLLEQPGRRSSGESRCPPHRQGPRTGNSQPGPAWEYHSPHTTAGRATHCGRKSQKYGTQEVTEVLNQSRARMHLGHEAHSNRPGQYALRGPGEGRCCVVTTTAVPGAARPPGAALAAQAPGATWSLMPSPRRTLASASGN